MKRVEHDRANNPSPISRSVSMSGSEQTVERCPNVGRHPYATCLLPVGHPGECITEGRPNLKYAAFFRVVAYLMAENERLRAGGFNGR